MEGYRKDEVHQHFAAYRADGQENDDDDDPTSTESAHQHLLGYLVWSGYNEYMPHPRVVSLQRLMVRSVLQLAQKWPDQKLLSCVMLFRHAGASFCQESLACAASGENGAEVLKQLKAIDPDVDIAKLGAYAVAIAARHNNREAVDWLLEQGVSLSTPIRKRHHLQDYTILYAALGPIEFAFEDRLRTGPAPIEMLQLLVDRGARLRYIPGEAHHFNFLHRFIERHVDDRESHKKVLQALQQWCDIADLHHPTAGILLEACAKSCNWITLTWLLDRLRDRKVSLDDGSAVLARAVWSHAPDDIIQRLLDAGACVDAAGDDGATAVMQACSWANLALLKQLVGLGADLHARDRERSTALHYACGAYTRTSHEAALQAELVQYLLHQGVDYREYDKMGETALDIVASNGNVELAILLLDDGADPNGLLPGIGYCSALDRAAGQGSLDMVKLLLNVGAVSAEQERSAFDGAIRWALRGQHHEIVSLIQQHAGLREMDNFEPWRRSSGEKDWTEIVTYKQRRKQVEQAYRHRTGLA
ncbi:ankyrin repeat-containing domain protein [Microdochium trichocladiopsis]|uniref:Ankyrin repeat-containing domain protein n=1 Tax=Microdochium trichocladiopsis TaxID=1682393 RepID=A0A9P9BSA3_9PEZI|nr:ankyrin repeat-containing domain protein [Microdochium trichocladiopsis]KAH7028120.1 ankyrin repeat-containing domain protein [Microdochium trichocladiopsis]